MRSSKLLRDSYLSPRGFLISGVSLLDYPRKHRKKKTASQVPAIKENYLPSQQGLYLLNKKI